jgi:protease-4
MSSPIEPGSELPRATQAPRVLPVYALPPQAPSAGSTVGRVLLALFLIASLGLNMFLLCGGFLLRSLATAEPPDAPLHERFLSGHADASDRIAIIRIEGPIVEGQLSYAHRQIESAAQNDSIKAVVVRIDSPGGSISASDDLHRQLSHLRDGTTPKFQAHSPAKKPLVVSMGSVAASGGYYIALPASEGAGAPLKKLFGERTTITGSIGVYAAFINAEELAKKYGVEMELIKAGAVKGSGSLFHRMTPQERQPWADMVEHAYKQFISIVEAGRPKLKGKLTEDLFPPKTVPVYDDRGNIVKDETGQVKNTTYTRQRADGGVFTSEEALEWGLIDAVGTLDDAVAEAARQAKLTVFKAVTYEKPITLLGLFSGTQAQVGTDVGRLATALSPRLWYLAPGAELSPLIQALGRER